MQYLVTMTTHVPDGTSTQAVDEVRGREAARSRQLAAEGHLLRLWRPPLKRGEWRTIGLFAANDDRGLETVLASMPLRVWRSDEVTPLSPHPNDPGANREMNGAGTEFLTTFVLAVPAGTSSQAVDEARAREAVRSRQLAEEGHLVRLWTLPGRGRALGLYRAHDLAEMKAVVESLPLKAMMTTEITPLTSHPNDPASRTQETAMGTPAPPRSDATTGAHAASVDMKLEAIAIPVSDVDRAKQFYAGLGWRLDADFSRGDGRVVQFTPPGSDCSVHFGTNLTAARPGSAQNLFLIVSDLQAARDDLLARGAKVSEVFHFAGLNRLDASARLSGPDPDRASYGSYASFSDPDGNAWLLQEITTRLPGRMDPATTAFGSTNDLATALRRAEAAHGEHERRTGQRDENWPAWYAAYMAAEQAGQALPS